MPPSLTQEIRALAQQAGFDLFGVCSAEPFEQERQRLTAWLDKSYAGEMTYLAKNTEKRLDPRQILPSAKSIVCLGISYYHPPLPLLCKEGSGEVEIAGRTTSTPPQPSPYKGEGDRGVVARYAWGKDYHKVLEKKLKTLKSQITQLTGPATELKDYTDTGPLFERQAAARVGLGFIGKNTLLVNPQHGSYFFLSEILINLELDYDTPTTTTCGSCRACLDACPTQAFPTPYTMDATRCISYWTIEARGEIPEEFHQGIGHHVFGCDICQEACPFNRRPLPSGCEEFAPTQGPGPALDLEKTTGMDEASFHEKFRHTSLTRAKFSGIMRNSKIVGKNLCSHAS